MDRVRVSCVGTNRLFAEALASVLGREEGVELAAPGGLPAAASSTTGRPADVVLVAADDDRARAVQLTREFRDRFPAAAVVVVGVDRGAETILAFVEAGASGYHLRDEPLAVLRQTIAAVRRGRPPCAPGLAAALFARLRERACGRKERGAAGGGVLSCRERDVAALLADGLTNKAIARRLGVRLATAKNHVHNVLTKLGARRRREAARPGSPPPAAGIQPGTSPPPGRS